MNDPAVVGAAADYVRIIIRRPHAYRFLNEIFSGEGGIVSATPSGGATADGTRLPLPGLYVLDGDGDFVASTPMRNVDEVLELLVDSESESASASRAEAGSTESASASIRVSGFIAAEGIT